MSGREARGAKARVVQEFSSAGRASVSKTEGRGFESLNSCQPGLSAGRRNPMCRVTEAGRTNRMSTDQTDNDSEPRRRGGPFRFWGEVRAEARKVTWATRQEVTVSTIMVLIMGVTAAIFFYFVDTILRLLVGLILGLGG